MSILEPVVIIGAGGSGRDVMDIFDALASDEPDIEMLGFVVDPEFGAPGTIVNDRPVLGGFDWLAANASKVQVICAVGSPRVRHHMVQRALACHARFCSVVHPNVVRSRWVQLGVGTVISAGCILTNRVVIGDHVQMNVACAVTHDTVVGDFTTLAPGVRLSGNVSVGEGCFLGTGSSVIERRRLGDWSTIGAGATVISDIPSHTTAVGTPARVVKEHVPE